MLLNLTRCWAIRGKTLGERKNKLDHQSGFNHIACSVSSLWMNTWGQVFHRRWRKAGLLYNSRDLIMWFNKVAVSVLILLFQSHIPVLWRTKWEREVSVWVQSHGLWDQGYGESCLFLWAPKAPRRPLIAFSDQLWCPVDSPWNQNSLFTPGLFQQNTFYF